VIVLHGEDAQLCDDLQHRLDYLRDRVREIWDGPIALPHFTRHGYDHCTRIEGHLKKLLPLLHHHLNLNEQYILLSGVWTHDIGMQDSRFSLGDKEITSFVDDKKDDGEPGTERAQDYLTLRDRHAEASMAWVMDVYNDIRPKKDLGLKRDDFAVSIATIVRAHTDYDLARLSVEQHVEGEPVRLRLLATLLIIADELDLDRRRVDLDTLSRINIPDDSKVHWWCHHYVDGVSISGHTPRVHMTLPRAYEGLLADQWKLQAASGLRKQMAKSVVRDTLDDAGCWLVAPEVQARYEDTSSKRLWPQGVPLDTRAAIQGADVQLLQGYKPKDIFSFFSVDLYGVPINDLNPDELDAIGEALINFVEAWGKLDKAHFNFLVRDLRDRVQRVLEGTPLSFLTKHYLYVRAHTMLLGRFEAQVTPNWDRPRTFPADPTEEYLWKKMRDEYAHPFLTTDDAYYRVRGMATSECATHPDIVDEIDRIIDGVSKRIAIATILSNVFRTRLDDNGAYQALGPFVTQFNREAGPLVKAASERMVQHHLASTQDALPGPAPIEPPEHD